MAAISEQTPTARIYPFIITIYAAPTSRETSPSLFAKFKRYPAMNRKELRTPSWVTVHIIAGSYQISSNKLSRFRVVKIKLSLVVVLVV